MAVWVMKREVVISRRLMTETTQALRCEIRADLRVTYFRYLKVSFY